MIIFSYFVIGLGVTYLWKSYCDPFWQDDNNKFSDFVHCVNLLYCITYIITKTFGG